MIQEEIIGIIDDASFQIMVDHDNRRQIIREAIQKAVAPLEQEIQALRKDKERLDWIEKQQLSVECFIDFSEQGYHWEIEYENGKHVAPKLRECIDAEMKTVEPLEADKSQLDWLLSRKLVFCANGTQTVLDTRKKVAEAMQTLTKGEK